MTFNLRDFRVMLGLCEALQTNIRLSFEAPGAPLVAEPDYGDAAFMVGGCETGDGACGAVAGAPVRRCMGVVVVYAGVGGGRCCGPGSSVESCVGVGWSQVGGWLPVLLLAGPAWLLAAVRMLGSACSCCLPDCPPTQPLHSHTHSLSRIQTAKLSWCWPLTN